MRGSDTLRVVLAVRRRKEQAEELLLAEQCERIEKARARTKLLELELASIGAARLQEVSQVVSGAHYVQIEAQYNRVIQQRSEAESQIEALERMRSEQVKNYAAALCARQIVSELRDRRKAAYDAELLRREQKRNEDLFLARYGRT